jgi:hypothetical protein
MGANDSRVTLYSGAIRTLDLLRLRNEAVPFTFKDNVPAGTYCKIALKLSDLELVLADNTPGDLTDNQIYKPKLPGNGILELVARNCFSVGPGEVVTLQIDIDAGNSILVNENDNGFEFIPVIYIDVLKDGIRSKLVRVDGKITEIDQMETRLLLCGAVPAHRMNSMGCLDLYLGNGSAFFDNVVYAGAPRPLEELLSPDQIGKTVTVVGWPRGKLKPYVDVVVPEGHYPPPGECKLWNINLEPGHQPPPIDCEDVPDILPVDTIVVTHDGVEKDPHYPLMVLDALAVELGDFLSVDGEVATDADLFGSTMDVGPGPIVTDTPLPVMIQTGGIGYNGTRIVSKAGEILDTDAVLAPLPVQVDGTLELLSASDPLLKAALIILDTDNLGNEQVTGKVLAVNATSFEINPDAVAVCGVATDRLRVSMTQDVEILTVIVSKSGSDIIPGGTLAAGQMVGMNGWCSPAGYETDSIVIVDDKR